MKTLNIFYKILIETIRDWKMLIMTLVFGPLFIFIFNGMYGEHRGNFKLIIQNQDKGVVYSEKSYNYGSDFIKLIRDTALYEGKKFDVQTTDDENTAKTLVRKGDASIFILLPEDFSSSLLEQRELNRSIKSKVYFYGDLTNENYMLPAISVMGAAEDFVYQLSGKVKPVELIEKSLVNMDNHKTFDSFVPAAIIMGWIMVLFTACTALIKEIDEGTILRLKLSGIKASEYVFAITINQIFIGLITVFSTIGTAVLVCGYKAQGSLLNVGIITVLSTLALVGISIIVSSFCRNISDILIIGNLPYFLILIFCGVFPMTKINLLKIGQYIISVNDILSPTHTLNAFKKILYEGMSLDQLGYEIIMISVLGILYFLIGIVLFKRKHKL